MAWTTPFTAVANVALTAAQWNSGVRDNLNYLFAAVIQNSKYKTANTTIASDATLNDDPHITGLSVEANAAYRYEIHADVVSPVAADIKFLITGPAGFDYQGVLWNPVTNSAVNMFAGTSVGPSTSGGTGTNSDKMNMVGWLTTAGTAGTLTLQWAQVTSDAGNTILRAGSHMIITRLA